MSNLEAIRKSSGIYITDVVALDCESSAGSNEAPKIALSISDNCMQGNKKVFTYGFRPYKAESLNDLVRVANRFSISPPMYRDGHRKQSNITEGGHFILIDCDELGQAEQIQSKLVQYDYVKVPSASNSNEKPYKWHFILPTSNPLSIYPAAMKWQVQQFFRQTGITDEMIDVTGSYDIVRQFAPASIGMSPEEADDLSEVHEGDMELLAPIQEPPEELCKAGVSSVDIDIAGKAVSKLPPEHLWYKGKAITYGEAKKAVLEAAGKQKSDAAKVVSGFGCPHDNHLHTQDRTRGYGFAFLGTDGDIVVKCTGNECKENPYFVIPPQEEVEFEDVLLEPISFPIAPDEFAAMVRQRVQDLEPSFVFSKSMMEGFAYYGAVYNECAYRNRYAMPSERFAIPAPTGSAKSVSSKLYLAITGKKGISGLLIVGKSSEARAAAEEINEIAGENLAACYYTVDKKHPVTDVRAEMGQLKNSPIAVITHNLFLSRSSTLENIKMLTTYDERPRETVIIDERIDFKRTVSFCTDELQGAIGLVHGIRGWSTVEEVFKMFMEFEPAPIGFSNHPHIKEMMQKGIQMLKRGDGHVGFAKDKKDESRERQDRNWLIGLIDRVAFVISHENIIVKQGKVVFYSANEDLTNKFGSTVILDATAPITPIYQSHALNRDDIRLYTMPAGIRDYSPATLHVCVDKNRRQSKSALVDKTLQEKSGKILESIVESYLEEFYPLVADGSKLLVCTFVDIEEIFRSKCKDPNISFIHWGEHAGTNAYSSYTKAAAVGWFRMSKKKYIEDIDAVRGKIIEYVPLTDSVTGDALNMVDTGVAAAMIQFFNRTASRVAIDERGRCVPVDFYIFDDTSSKTLITLLQQELPGLKIQKWEPVRAYPIIKMTKRERLAERIIEWLLTRPGHTIAKESIMNHFNIKNAVFRKTMDTAHFQDLIEESGIDQIIRRGRGGGTFFSVPEKFDPPMELEREKRRMISITIDSL